MRRAPLLAVLLAASPVYSQSFSSDEKHAALITPEYFTIDMKSVTVEPLAETVPLPPAVGGSPAPSVADLGTIINIGKQVWDIIVANKPVVDVQTSYAAAMPKGITEAAQLSGWKAPEATVYQLKAKNVYGTEVINLRYAVLRTYGGAYKGRGRFLTAVAVQPMKVDVLWGYRFTMEASAKSTTNAGTASDPIGALMLVLNWKIETPLKESRGSGVYYVQGDGLFKELAGSTRTHKLLGPLKPPRWDF